MTQPYIPGFLEEAFESRFTHTDDAVNKCEFYVLQIGQLKIVEGKIIACDPFLYNNDTPFNTIFPIGYFPVELAIAKIDTDERVGFSRIKFSDNIPVKWTIAICEGQNISDLKQDEIFGYGVDAGTGAFMDITGGKELMSFLTEKENNFQVLIDEMEKTYKHTWDWLLWERNNNNVAMFKSGWGDGVYATYIGYDREDNICRLVTDFQVV